MSNDEPVLLCEIEYAHHKRYAILILALSLPFAAAAVTAFLASVRKPDFTRIAMVAVMSFSSVLVCYAAFLHWRYGRHFVVKLYPDRIVHRGSDGKERTFSFSRIRRIERELDSITLWIRSRSWLTYEYRIDGWHFHDQAEAGKFAAAASFLLERFSLQAPRSNC